MNAISDAVADCTEFSEKLREQFISAMGNAATGVTVVGTDGEGGRFAQTVSAMCSVSADPPTVLVCVNRRSPIVAATEINRSFSVNVLAANQAQVADTFAGRPEAGEPYDFGCASWTTLRTGAPVLLESSATFDCRLVDVVESGTHRLFLGAVETTRVKPVDPLLYRARQYGRCLPLGA
ncbi:flavin reductase family protein [Amycolatopsis palatopharyngis]|uniref:flavin reductase family protein n=1 Tax=Amycolatopsis palatopharyngis TaxID=187982 RepID=UPI0013BE8B01|nr:flavin reductase family protein [Amycolatopsis palatopharyngis]